VKIVILLVWMNLRNINIMKECMGTTKVNCLRCGHKVMFEMYRPQGRCTNANCTDYKKTPYQKEKEK
jgi:DNA-directed RNA polymerase subunit RPC12/RpoP